MSRRAVRRENKERDRVESEARNKRDIVRGDELSLLSLARLFVTQED